MIKKILQALVILSFISCTAQTKTAQTPYPTTQHKALNSGIDNILPGAYQTAQYLPLLQNKRVAVFANQTSVIGNTHLVDSLQKLHVNIVTIFGPEHGFRGTADAGEKVDTYIDNATGVKVISLYGKKLKPSSDDLKDVDVILFDIQDVGVRFYTYISSLQYLIESAVVNNKPLIILDRPNPNGFFVDGPVLDTTYKSFIGMQPIPVVYGMTIGEYGKMLYGERMLAPEAAKLINSAQQQSLLTVIKCENYTHNMRYTLPVKPSPNLPDSTSIYWYPSTCFFEGTVLSEGRGTQHPFAVFGHPSLPNNLFSFTPQSTEGASNPKLKDQLCYGWNLSAEPLPNNIQLQWLLNAYKLFPDKSNFFIKSKTGLQKDYFFNRLAGNSELMQQIISGASETEIRASWQPKLQAFKAIRKKYLLYEDFE